MTRIIAYAALLSLSLRAQAQESFEGPSWKFVRGATWKCEIEYVKHYRMEGGPPETVGKDVFKDDLRATASFEVAAADAGTAELKVRFLSFRAGLGSDGDPDVSIYDSARQAQNRAPVEWAAMIPEIPFTLRVDASGSILSIEGMDLDRHLSVARYALLGGRLLAAPAPRSGDGEWKGSIQVLHDVECASQRFDLKETTLHEVPLVFQSRREDGKVTVEGAVPAGTALDLGKKGRESFVPGVGFTGRWKGIWRDGSWEETGWSVRGTVKLKSEGREMKLELHERYSARRMK